MKRNAVGTLIKDIVLALVTWGICAFLLKELFVGGGSLTEEGAKTMAMLFAGIPFGWRWASKIITAVSMKGVAIKLGISIFLGWIAFFVVLIGDVIRCFTEKSQRMKKEKQHIEQE